MLPSLSILAAAAPDILPTSRPHPSLSAQTVPAINHLHDIDKAAVTFDKKFETTSEHKVSSNEVSFLSTATMPDDLKKTLTEDELEGMLVDWIKERNAIGIQPRRKDILEKGLQISRNYVLKDFKFTKKKVIYFHKRHPNLLINLVKFIFDIPN